MSLAAEIKATLSLVAEAEASGATWDRGKTRRAAGDFWSPCPLHAEETASFHVTEKGGAGGVFHCFGCQAKGSIVDFVMARDGLDFTTAVRKLGAGIARKPDPVRQAEIAADRDAKRARAEAEEARQAERGLAKARAIWREAIPGDPRLAAYLEGRGLRLDALGGVPATLRLHPDLPCYVGQEDGRPRLVHRGPAMIAAIGRRGGFVGVHRTWIDGPARARSETLGGKVPKQMLGARGSIYGAPVVLTPPAPLVIVGEGIETTLAALVAWRLRFPRVEGMVSAEAALSLDALTGPADPEGRPDGIGRHGHALPSPRPALGADNPGWTPAPHVRRAIVLADPSTKCPETARLHAERGLAKIAPRCPEGATLAIPRGSWDHDDDFCDLALRGEF